MAQKRSEEYQVNMFVPDLHSFTTPIDHRMLYDQIIHNIKLFVAAGLPLDNPNIHVYRQSHVPAHSELTWILDCFTGFGEMSRMTQFKDKSAKLGGVDTDSDRISVGLFNYPVLMAADVLLYGATYVPVGDDQTQHIEFMRDIAERMNNKFANVFPDGLFIVPASVPKQHAFFGKDQGLRIRDLQDPTKKMSKSDESGKGIIFLGDDPKGAAQKIMSATTDSEGIIHLDQTKQPGIANLLQILALLSQKDITEVAQAWDGKTSYGEFKKAVADQVENFLSEFQSKLSAVDQATIDAKLSDSEEKMNTTANETLLRAQKAVGLRPL